MKRTKTILDAKYIISFTLRFFIIVLIGFSLSGLIIIASLDRKVGPTYLDGIFTLSQLQTHLPLILFATAFIQAVALCIIALFIALLWSHGIAGPLVRFRRHLREVAQGKFQKEPLIFREADQLHGLAHAFSEMIFAHKERNMKALTLLVEAQRLLDECEGLKAQGKSDTHKFKSNLKNLEKVYLQIKGIYFEKVSGR